MKKKKPIYLYMEDEIINKYQAIVDSLAEKSVAPVRKHDIGKMIFLRGMQEFEKNMLK